MDGLIFVSVGDAMTIHRRMVDEFDGDSGLRDRGLLESALAMPKAMFGGDYLHVDLPSMAAAYHYHLCANHPFVDGNKRVAVAVAEVLSRDTQFPAVGGHPHSRTRGSVPCLHGVHFLNYSLDSMA